MKTHPTKGWEVHLIQDEPSTGCANNHVSLILPPVLTSEHALLYEKCRIDGCAQPLADDSWSFCAVHHPLWADYVDSKSEAGDVAYTSDPESPIEMVRVDEDDMRPVYRVRPGFGDVPSTPKPKRPYKRERLAY